MLTIQESRYLQTLLTAVKCPRCQQPITHKSLTPEGIELPHCCSLFWIPVWRFSRNSNPSLEIHLNFYDPTFGTAPLPDNALVEVSENQPETETVNADIDTETAEIPEGSVEGSVDNSEVENQQTAVSEQPLMVATAEELTVKEKITEFLINVNGQHEARAGEILQALDIVPSTFKWARDEMLEAGLIEKVGHGRWKLLRP